MRISIESRHLCDIIVLAPEAFVDERGLFMEVFRADRCNGGDPESACNPSKKTCDKKGQ